MDKPSYEELWNALVEIASVGDGFGATNQNSGTTGEGHNECRSIALSALGLEWHQLPANSDDASLFWSRLSRTKDNPNG